MVGNLRDLTLNRDGTQNVTVTVNSDFRKQFDKLKGERVTVEIKKEVRHRSKTANDYLWAMCTDIGKAMTPPLPKEMIYRQAIRDVGEYQAIPIRPEAVETFVNRWAVKGIGWFAEIVDDIWLKGQQYKLVFAYYGSSTYDTTAMSKVIDYLKQDMESMGLSIPLSKAEEERLFGKAE